MDLYRLYRRPRALSVLGAAFSALLLGVTTLVVAQFNGVFSGDPQLTVELPPRSTVVAKDSPVTYRDVRVGTVTSEVEADGAGASRVEVEIEGRWIDRLPRDVVATVGPVSIFGNQYIQLLAPDEEGAAGLADGAVIPAYDVAETPSLQGTFVSLNDLLTQVSPARLNAGLSGLAGSLQGQGEELGRTLVATNDYLGLMLPLWPTLVKDIEEAAKLAGGLSEITPEFLSLVENATISAETVTDNAEAFEALVRDGGRLATTSSALLRATTASYADTVDGAVALLGALSQSPNLITKLLRGLERWADAWAPVLEDGLPDIRLTALSVRNPADMVLAMTAGGGNREDVVRLLNRAIRPGFANPPTYTGCPQPLCSLGRSEGSTR